MSPSKGFRKLRWRQGVSLSSQEKIANRLRDAEGRALRAQSIEIGEDDPFLTDLRRKLTGLEETVEILLAQLPELAPRAKTFLAKYGPAFQDLYHCPRFARLSGLLQFGVKRHVAATQEVLHGFPPQLVTVTTSPFLHSRATHSKQVAAHMVLVGLQLDLSSEEIASAAFGALLHDVGYGAFSHDTEGLFHARRLPSHEERGQAIVRSDADIQESLALADVHVGDVIVVMREEGKRGQLQKIMDTLAYVRLDCLMMDRPVPETFSSDAIRTLTHIDERGITVNDTRPLRDLLERRAELCQRMYYSWRNRVTASAAVAALSWMVRERLLPLELIEHGTDADVEWRMTQLMNDGTPIPEPVRSAWSLAHGFFDECEAWDIRELANREAVEAVLIKEPPELATHAIVSAPFDYTGKTIRVQMTAGVPVILKATSVVPKEWDLKWILLVPKR